MKKLDSLVCRWVLGGSIVFVPAVVLAQVAPAAPTATAAAPTAPASTAAAPTAAAPTAPAPSTTEMAPAPAAPATTAAPAEPMPMAAEPMPMAEPMAAAEPIPEAAAEEAEDEGFKVTTGVGLRFSLGMYNHSPKVNGPGGDGAEGLNVDELSVEPRFSGQVTDVVGWTANFQASGQSGNTIANATDANGDGVINGRDLPPYRFEVQALDLIAQLDFMPEFHMWFGRMLTAADRSNFSGPWFMSPWNYPGSYFLGGGPYVGPRGTEEIGREVGTTIWGDVGEGKFKYYAGVLDLDNPELSPLLTGRLGYAIIGSEPGFYGSSTYYGSQDILAVGVGGQYQKQSATDNPATANVDESKESLSEFNADLLAEFNVAGAGTLTGEAAYYNMKGPAFPTKGQFFVLGSYTTEHEIGIGKLQPLVRFQKAIDPGHQMVDFWLSYVMKDYFAKLALGYTMVKLDAPGDPKTNILQLGFQIQQ